MATYQFLSITEGEALNYDAARDDLRFDGLSGRVATDFYVREVFPAFALHLRNGGSVVFGGGVEGERLVLPDGSIIAFPGRGSATVEGGPGADNLYGGQDHDLLRGLVGADALDGGSGDDTLVGGLQADYLMGGFGADTFVFAPGDSGTSEGAID
ncbi:calcium-binding protein, partial [Phenylobacterium sp.]|uniref:calcium-binding protein n=1 Tax=Phenylobacterium sp. TaxID=1871053 RepID=UPI002EF1F4C2